MPMLLYYLIIVFMYIHINKLFGHESSVQAQFLIILSFFSCLIQLSPIPALDWMPY